MTVLMITTISWSRGQPKLALLIPLSNSDCYSVM